ncbi:unnamed protein product, partial [Pylaiella littoralis]
YNLPQVHTLHSQPQHHPCLPPVLRFREHDDEPPEERTSSNGTSHLSTLLPLLSRPTCSWRSRRTAGRRWFYQKGKGRRHASSLSGS